MTKVLITGAFGYIGGRVSRYLAEQDHELVLGSHGVAAPAPDWLSKGRVVPCDLFDDAQLQAACRSVHSIVHLASINENKCAADPALALHVNGLGSLRALLAAIQAGASRFIYLSTAHVYAAPLSGAIDEKTLPRPLHPYAISHRVAEDFVMAAHAKGEIEAVVLRLSNGFGAPERADVDRWTLLTNDLCRQAAVTRRMIMRSSGNDERDFITLADTARAIDHFLRLERASLGDGLFNVGSGRSVHVIEVVELIAQRCEAILGFRPEIVRPAAQTAVTRLDYRIDKLLSTGFSPVAEMQFEIDATLRLCRDAFADKT